MLTLYALIFGVGFAGALIGSLVCMFFVPWRWILREGKHET
jgi:hypothetical protein